MNRFIPLMLLSAAILAFATVFLVILPADEIRTAAPAPGLSLIPKASYVDVPSMWILAVFIVTVSSLVRLSKPLMCSVVGVDPLLPQIMLMMSRTCSGLCALVQIC